MPFTVSHVIAALPLNNCLGERLNKYTALSPLIIGSMTPDFAYLTPFLVNQRMDSHSLIGLYLYCIPMGLTIYFLYHLLMAPVWISLLPDTIRRRLNPNLSLGKLPDISSHVLIISLVLGATTHIVWDYFTHETGIPRILSFMDMPLMTLDGYDIMSYRVLQHLSSVLGLVALMYIVFRWYKRSHNNNFIKGIQWQASKQLKLLAMLTLFGLSTIVGAIFGLMNLPETDVLYGLYSAQIVLKTAIVVGSGVFILGSVVIGLIYQVAIRKN